MTLLDAKNGEEYLDGSINLHGDEKSEQFSDAIEGFDGEDMAILEVGPGGGSALQGLADRRLGRTGRQLAGISISALELFDSKSVSLRAALDDLGAQGAATSISIGDVTDLPFEDETFDAVNLSAVLHEVYSHSGNGERSHQVGIMAVRQALGEVTRVLRPGGKLMYRDVYPVDASLQMPVEQCYDHESWVQFARRFTPHYLKGDVHQYDRDRVNIRNTSGTFSAEMPIGLARETQRHYITFRDHLIRTHALGLHIDSERYDDTEWKKTVNGFEKKIYLDPEHPDQDLGDMEVNRDRTGSFVVASEFDLLVDDRIVDFFARLDFLDDEAQAVYDEWFEREGRESYIWASASDVVDEIRFGGTRVSQNERSAFVIARPGDVAIAEREHYSGYLERVLGRSAIADKKLLINFTKE